VGGNWKMNTTRRSAADLARAVASEAPGDDADVVVFPPFVYLDVVAATLREQERAVGLGAQDVFYDDDGAFTGEVSTTMLQDLGAGWALAGHSERRHVIGETDEIVARKAHRILDAGLMCVLCVGETLEQREAGQTDAVNEGQLRAALRDLPRAFWSRLVIAYEPVWAIGTGRTATPGDAQSAHEAIRYVLAELCDDEAAATTRIVYGGSVKPGNASDLFSQNDIDGGLIGGASLKSGDFVAICRAAAQTAPV
jgi:triosephosphate isomerase